MTVDGDEDNFIIFTLENSVEFEAEMKVNCLIIFQEFLNYIMKSQQINFDLVLPSSYDSPAFHNTIICTRCPR